MRLVLLCLLIGLISGCAEKTYRYRMFVEFPAIASQRGPTEDGDPKVCEEFFSISNYMGRSISIPDTAETFAALVVSNGTDLQIMPLRTWTDDKGAANFACNGPSPRFAQRAKSQDQLIQQIIGMVQKKRD